MSVSEQLQSYPAPTQKNRLVLGKGRGIKKPNQTI